MATDTLPIPSETYFDLVWENPNPLQSFASQTVVTTGDLTDASGVLIFYLINITDMNRLMSVIHFPSTGYGAMFGVYPSGTALRSRRFYCTFAENKVTFGNGYNNTTQNNDNCIPYRIYKLRY